MLRQGRSTLALLAGCFFCLWSALPAPAQGVVHHGGGKGAASGGGNAHRPPAPGTGQPGGAKTTTIGATSTVPATTPVVNTGNGNAGTGVTLGNTYRGGFGYVPRVQPSIQSGIVPGPYGSVNLVGNWWQQTSPYSLLNGASNLNNLALLSSLGMGNSLYNPLYNYGINPLLAGNPLLLGNTGLLGMNNPFLLGNTGLLGMNNPFLLGNTGLLGLNNPFLNGFNSVNYWGNNMPFGVNPLLQQGIGFNSPFLNPFANPWGMSPFANPWANPVFPGGGGINPLAPAINNPFAGFPLF